MKPCSHPKHMVCKLLTSIEGQTCCKYAEGLPATASRASSGTVKAAKGRSASIGAFGITNAARAAVGAEPTASCFGWLNTTL